MQMTTNDQQEGVSQPLTLGLLDQKGAVPKLSQVRWSEAQILSSWMTFTPR